jgi:hypothetical protein
MIKKRVAGVGVDAGMIMICDQDYYEKYKGFIDNRISKTIDVPTARYDVSWMIPESWNGTVSGKGVLDVTSGKVIISDPCYVIPGERWDEWLKDTNMGENPPAGTLILDNMGGDGEYRVFLELENATNTENSER